MFVVQICLAMVALLVLAIVVALWNDKVAYLGGWSCVWHTLFGTDRITKLREGLWVITSPGGFNPSTNMFGTKPDAQGHTHLWCSGDGVWSPARIRAIKQLMRELRVNQISDFLLGHPDPDHTGGLSELFKLGTPNAKVYTSRVDSWQLLEPSTLPKRMDAIMRQAGTRYLGWPLNAMYWIWPLYSRFVFGHGACGITSERVKRLDTGATFRFNGYQLQAYELGGHSPGEFTFLVIPDGKIAAEIILASDVIDLTDTERSLVTPMPLPHGRFVRMKFVLEWIRDHQADTLVVEHGGILRGAKYIEAYLNRVLAESDRIITAVQKSWPAKGYSANFKAFTVDIFHELGYKVSPALTRDEMASIVASIATELNLK